MGYRRVTADKSQPKHAAKSWGDVRAFRPSLIRRNSRAVEKLDCFQGTFVIEVLFHETAEVVKVFNGLG